MEMMFYSINNLLTVMLYYKTAFRNKSLWYFEYAVIK